jgi:small-conductance mechanosensitive channel
VSVRLWDQRRLVVPLQWIIENPFTNWTRSSSEIIGTVYLSVDYRTPLAPLRSSRGSSIPRPNGTAACRCCR